MFEKATENVADEISWELISSIYAPLAVVYARSCEDNDMHAQSMMFWLRSLLDAANAKFAGFCSDKNHALVDAFNRVLCVLADAAPKPPQLPKAGSGDTIDNLVHRGILIEKKLIFLSQPLYLGLRILGMMIAQGLEGDCGTLNAVRKLMYNQSSLIQSAPMIATPIEPHQLLLALPSIFELRKSKQLPLWVNRVFESHLSLPEHIADTKTPSLQSSISKVLRGKLADKPMPLFGFTASPSLSSQCK